jgi:signal transduction histidine kinase
VNRDEALPLLLSGSTHLRRTAARVMAREAQAGDLATLRVARTTEVDSYARASLDAAIAKLTDALPAVKPDSDEAAEGSERSKRLIQARATEWIAGLLLHELAPPLGLLAYTASLEVPDFERSRTKSHIAALQMVFAAIEQLRKASATPRPTELDLASLTRQIVETEFADNGDLIALHGPQPMLLTSDEALLRFAICNGLRNAIEAIGNSARGDSPPIVITWGETDTDYWVAILDRGPGIPASIESVLGIGKTTKEGHSGFGLPIAVAAMEALGGTITLQPAVNAGTKFELRWPR